jgi:hypothetical protein
MTAGKAILGVMLCAAWLSACASAPASEQKAWTGGDPGRLAADQTTCRKEADNVDSGQANGYSDSRYGVSTALAEAIDRDDPFKDHRGDARKAAFITCMSDKGWHPG